MNSLWGLKSIRTETETQEKQCETVLITTMPATLNLNNSQSRSRFFFILSHFLFFALGIVDETFEHREKQRNYLTVDYWSN